MTAADVSRDFLAVIQIRGMHSHRCEDAIRDALTQYDGVHEVEVDFPSGQASILYDNHSVDAKRLLSAVIDAGYTALGMDQFASHAMVA